MFIGMGRNDFKKKERKTYPLVSYIRQRKVMTGCMTSLRKIINEVTMFLHLQLE